MCADTESGSDAERLLHQENTDCYSDEKRRRSGEDEKVSWTFVNGLCMWMAVNEAISHLIGTVVSQPVISVELFFPLFTSSDLKVTNNLASPPNTTFNFLPVKYSHIPKNCLSGQQALQLLIIQFISTVHHYECVAIHKDVSLQRGGFWASSLASCSSRYREERSPWMVFIQVVCGRPGGRLQLSGGGSRMIWLTSASHPFSQHAQRKKDDETWQRMRVVTDWSYD